MRHCKRNDALVGVSNSWVTSRPRHHTFAFVFEKKKTGSELKAERSEGVSVDPKKNRNWLWGFVSKRIRAETKSHKPETEIEELPFENEQWNGRYP